ncbi:MAG: GAF domain-containing protein [Anaerolineae bacterium]|jgi:signal transduction histidine kinase
MFDRSNQDRESYERYVARFKMINDVLTALTQSFDLEQTLDDILDKVLELLAMNVGAVYLLDEEDQGLTLVAQRNLPEEVADCKDGLKSARMLARHEKLQCKLAGPLRSKGEIKGLLFVGDLASCPILRQEVELLTTICNTIGMFVENVRLYQERIRQLQIESAVLQVSAEVTSELELDRVLPKIMHIAVEVAGADGGIIALLDEERHMIRYPYVENLPPGLADVTVSKEEGVSGQVITTGRPTVIDNYKTYHQRVPAFAEAGLTSVATVPIVSGDRTFGALSVLSIEQAKGYSEREMDVLTAIGRQAGIAIENAYLYENMRFYARKITQAQENERKRIARELHDDTIQSLIAISRRLEALSTSEPDLPDTAAERIHELQHTTSDVINRVRRFSQDLRPSTLDYLGLVPTLEELVGTINRHDGLRAELWIHGDQRRLSSEVELTLFRIVQEALNNVIKHADADRVVTVVEMTDSNITVTVQDDGKGFQPSSLAEHPATASRLGLLGMQERARLLGGMLAIDSTPEQGTKVTVSVPV